MKQLLGFEQLAQLAIAEGATSPNPGGPGVVAYSTTLSKPVWWNGTAWSSIFGASGGGSAAIVKKLTATQANSTVTPADVTQLVTALEANSVYKVTCFLTFHSAATTTGAGIGFTSPAGTINQVEVIVPISTAAANTQLLKIFPNATEIQTGEVLGTGVTATASNHTAKIIGLIHVGATAGNWAPRFRSEVAGSAITLQIGSSIALEKIA